MGMWIWKGASGAALRFRVFLVRTRSLALAARTLDLTFVRQMAPFCTVLVSFVRVGALLGARFSSR